MIKPPLRLAVFSSNEAKYAVPRARDLERILNNSAAGIGIQLGELEDDSGSAPPLAERIEMRWWRGRPTQEPAEWLDATLHTLIVVLVEETLLADLELVKWIRDVATHAKLERSHRLRLLAVHFSEAVQDRWQAEGDSRSDSQGLLWTGLDRESAGRADQLALRVLHSMIRLLARGIPGSGDKLRLFISHAKGDGFYLAQSFRHFIADQAWLESFYDARDIEAGDDWKEALEEAVERSILLVLRTDLYEQRFWCRQEVRWAQYFGVPQVIVDARSSLTRAATDLALESSPTLLIPDGNLARPLFAALQVALRMMLCRRRVIELERQGQIDKGAELRLFGTAPSIEALVRIGQAPSATETRTLIIYPDPPLGEGQLAAALAVFRDLPVQLATPGQLGASEVKL